MRTDRFNADIVKLNEIDRAEVEKQGVKYIDIWDAFADQNGQYDASGPNVDGQNVKLRGADGIHFTKAGARKVAHFLEAEIKPRLRQETGRRTRPPTLPPDIEQAAGDINAQIRREMGAPAEPARRDRPRDARAAQAARRADPVADRRGRFRRAARSPRANRRPPARPTLVARVLRLGEPADPRTGRADDFSWPRL